MNKIKKDLNEIFKMVEAVTYIMRLNGREYIYESLMAVCPAIQQYVYFTMLIQWMADNPDRLSEVDYVVLREDEHPELVQLQCNNFDLVVGFPAENPCPGNWYDREYIKVIPRIESVKEALDILLNAKHPYRKLFVKWNAVDMLLRLKDTSWMCLSEDE